MNHHNYTRYNTYQHVLLSNEKRKVVRGGSWKDVKYFLQVSSRDYEYENQPRSYIGFRTVHDYLGADMTANAMTNTTTKKRNNKRRITRKQTTHK